MSVLDHICRTWLSISSSRRTLPACIKLLLPGYIMALGWFIALVCICVFVLGLIFRGKNKQMGQAACQCKVKTLLCLSYKFMTSGTWGPVPGPAGFYWFFCGGPRPGFCFFCLCFKICLICPICFAYLFLL